MLPELGAKLADPHITLERIRVCKRDGVNLAEPRHVPDTDPSGLGIWQKLMVYAGEQSRHRGRPLSHELIRALRVAGAAGATSLRGIWGYHGDHAPHGDVFWQLRRRVPVLTVVFDTPDRIRDWFAIVDELTDETGVVTSELVPAYRATDPSCSTVDCASPSHCPDGAPRPHLHQPPRSRRLGTETASSARIRERRTQFATIERFSPAHENRLVSRYFAAVGDISLHD